MRKKRIIFLASWLAHPLCSSALLSLIPLSVLWMNRECSTNKVCLVCLLLRSQSILNCASPSNSGSTVGGLLFDGQMNDSLLDSLMDPPSLTSLCPPMQVHHFFMGKFSLRHAKKELSVQNYQCLSMQIIDFQHFFLRLCLCNLCNM